MGRIEALRTPDERFVNLPQYNFAPHYAVVEPGQLRIHFIDEGPRNGQVVLLLHGEPSWCFLYRKVIARLVPLGYRVVAPDLIGFGRSDKPLRRTDYTYERHVQWLEHLVVGHLNLTNITLFVQDWGGLLGLRIVANHPDRFARVVASNTGLPIGNPPTQGFLTWLEFSQSSDSLDVGNLFAVSSAVPMSEEVQAAYDAPFPDKTYQAGALQFPTLVPITKNADAEANIKAWEVLSKFNKPFLCAFSDRDPVTRGGEQVFIKMVPGARNQRHVTIKDGGHFVQEDQPEQIANVIHAFVQANPSNKL